jgi:hypothetical protein
MKTYLLAYDAVYFKYQRFGELFGFIGAAFKMVMGSFSEKKRYQTARRRFL